MSTTGAGSQTENQPAASLEDAIWVFNPQKPLEGNQMAFYVDRGSQARRDMKSLLIINDYNRKEPIHLLFSGHTGSGKSTELNILCQELVGRFFIVKVSTRNIVAPTDLTYVDVTLIAAMALFRAATEQEIIGRAPVDAFGDWWQDLVGFIRDRVFGQVPYREPKATLEVGAKVSALVVEFETKYKSEATSREQIRRQVENQLSEVIEKINILAGIVRAKTGHPVLFVFDDTDKPDPERARKLFFDGVTTLTALQASAIYTFNISLWFSHEFKLARDAYRGGRHLLSNVKVHDRVTGRRDIYGWGIMRRILESRLQSELITPTAVDALIEASGGLVRTLIGLAQFAAVNAFGRGATKIEEMDVERAVVELRNDFIAALEEEDYAILALRHADKRLSGDARVERLIQSLALLQYENGETWCDVHPVVVKLLQERMP